MIKQIGNFLKRDTLLRIVFLFALLSMLAVPPTAAYLDYINWKVLCLLFCLMAVVLGFQSCGLFQVMAQRLLLGCGHMRTLVLILTLLPFFTSMLVTNDVSLITFVPLAVFIMQTTGYEKELAWVVVLQTIAANLGSMVTQIGNPQNLYLYSYYNIPAKQFFMAVLPVAVVALLILSVSALMTKPQKVTVSFESKAEFHHPKLVALYIALFSLCLFSVFNILDYRIVTGVLTVCFFTFSRRLLLRVDYSLLLTFICFFIFSGNLGNLPAVNAALKNLLGKSTLLTSVLASQIISNVPAAVLLSKFTVNWRELLLGVNIGGLGTPIASLASLISLKIYACTENAQKLHYLKLFMLANIICLCILFGTTIWLLRYF